MTRIADIEEAPLSSEAARVFEEIASGPRGRVEGPLRIWLHRPKLAHLSQALGAYCRYDSGLEPRLSELAILVVGAHWRAGFEWAVHAPIAAKAGVCPVAIEAIRRGRVPILAAEDERIIYEFSRSILATGRVPDSLFGEARAVLGELLLVDLVGVLGYYSYIAMTINAFEVAPPDRDPFADLVIYHDTPV